MIPFDRLRAGPRPVTRFETAVIRRDDWGQFSKTGTTSPEIMRAAYGGAAKKPMSWQGRYVLKSLGKR